MTEEQAKQILEYLKGNRLRLNWLIYITVLIWLIIVGSTVRN